MREKMEKCLYCNTILSQFNPYRICYVHQGKVLRERLPVCLKKELQRLKLLAQKNQRSAVLTQKERKRMRHSLSQLLKNYSDKELIEILKNPEEIFESLLIKDKDKAEGFAEAVIFLREKKAEIIQKFLRKS